VNMAAGPARRRNGLALGPLVLEYHAVSETWPADLSVTPSQFREQLERLLDKGYVGATLSDAARETAEPRRMVAVTFDDAHLSVFELAYPILSSLGLAATVFAVTDFVEDGRPLHWQRRQDWDGTAHEHEMRGMNWAQLAQLAEAGWEIGSHTRTHPRLTQLANDTLDRELRGSREACEEALGRPCRSLAYPFGDADARVAHRAAAAGYTVAAIEDPGRLDPFLYPRVGIYRRDSMARFRMKVSPLVRQLRTMWASR
jgi:peptidoglycan/xylan/chitin deacetylase (PgdA/CDA1 family)